MVESYRAVVEMLPVAEHRFPVSEYQNDIENYA